MDKKQQQPQKQNPNQGGNQKPQQPQKQTPGSPNKNPNQKKGQF